MESSLTIIAITLILSLSLQTTPSNGQYCNSTKFQAPKKKFNECVELAELGSTLHYTYNATNSSLSIGFISSPAKPGGWVAWAINPTGTGMVGSQALIAFKSNGSLIVDTYNVTFFPQQSKLSFDVWDLSAESDGKNFVIFATVKVPEKAATVNQVWQVGPSVSNGVPDKHEMQEANRKSVGVLKLVGGGEATVPAPAEEKKSGVGRIGKSILMSAIGFSVCLLWFI